MKGTQAKTTGILLTIFDEQCHCGVDHFDFYLLHNMGHNAHAKCEEHDTFG